jgi:NADP-dependent 3-hydroxy acid dehydrogenase YdfG
MANTAKGAAPVTGASSGIGAIYGKGVRPQGWTMAFAEQSEKSFADTLAEDVRLEASTLARPIVGRNRVKHVMGAAKNIRGVRFHPPG